MNVIIIFCVFFSPVLFGGMASAKVVGFPLPGTPPLEPAYVQSDSGFFFYNQTHETLISFDKNSQLTPALAKRWEPSLDGASYTFFLNETAKFSDGQPINSTDVKLSLERCLKILGRKILWIFENVVGAQDFIDGNASDLKGIKILDDKTFTIQLKNPMPLFLTFLTTPYMKIIKFGGNKSPVFINKIPIGTGPYYVSKYDDKEILLKRNDSYWRGKPQIEEVRLYVYNAPSDQIEWFNAGKIELLNLSDERYKNSVKRNYKLISFPMMSIYYLGFNMKDEIVGNRDVRKAIVYAINKNELLTNTHKKDLKLAHAFVPKGFFGDSMNLFNHPYDINIAKGFYNEAVKKFGDKLKRKPIEIKYPKNSSTATTKEEVDAICRYLENVGFLCKGISVDYDQLEKDLQNGNFQAMRMGYTADYQDPDAFLYPFVVTNQQYNYMGYSNNSIDMLLNIARQLFEPRDRSILYKKVGEILDDELPCIVLYYGVGTAVYSNALSNLNFTLDGFYGIEIKNLSIEGS